MIGFSLGVVIVVSILGGAVSDRLFGYRILDRFFPPRTEEGFHLANETQRILREESMVIEVAEKVSPSVVTINISKTQTVYELPNLPSFEFFFGFPEPERREETIEQDIATGFIISEDGLIITNKHVVLDPQADYRVITRDDKSYEIEKIYRDPTNDIAILKINASGLSPVELGDSDNLKVGQFVIAIGTALGEFRHTVTTGVISGLGRGIRAGSPLEGYVEELDNVIQTDAAINPGNSGGPLLNSAGQVIGVNVAVAVSGQNIGFALPINIVKDSIDNFYQTGEFSRPFLGIRYRMIPQEVALMNKVPQGALIAEVIANSPADQAGIETGDIITHLDNQRITEEEGGLAAAIANKKVGQTINITVWRDGEEIQTRATLIETEG